MNFHTVSLASALVLCLAHLGESGSAPVDWYDFVAEPLAKQFGWNRLFSPTSEAVEAYYKLANKHIEDENLSEDDIDGNIKVAVRRVAKEEHTLLFTRRKHAKEAVERLKNLVIMDEECGLDSFAVMRLNDKAVIGRAHVGQPTNKIERIVNKELVLHANVCGPRYYEGFRRNEGKIDAANRNLIQKFTEAIAKKATGDWDFPKSLRSSPNTVCDYLNDLSSPEFDNQRSRYIFEVYESLIPKSHPLKEFTRRVEAARGKKLINERYFNALYNEFLVAPCTQFVKELGPILLPAIYDTETLGRSLTGSRGDESLEFRFNYSLLQFKICARVIATPNYILDMLRGHAESF